MPAGNRTTDPSATAPAAAGPPPLGSVPALLPATWVDPPGGMLDLTRSHPIAEVVARHRAQVGGRVRSIRVRPWGDVLTLEAVIADDTAAITVGFLGRRQIAGIRPGGWLTVEGMVGVRNGKLVILNPAYDLRPPA